MSVQTISFKPPGPTSDGDAVPEGSDIPVMRPRTKRGASDRHMVALLDEALEDLARTDCTFWACEGPSKPRHMATCCKCWAMRSIATVRATLAARGVSK